MRHKNLFFFFTVCFQLLLPFYALTQTTTLTPVEMRMSLLKKAEPKMIYPFLKGSYLSGILPVESPSDLSDYTGVYKLLFDFAAGNPDDLKNGNINPGIQEIIRIINLHKASGIPENRMEIAVIIHGPSTMSFLGNEEYKKRFAINNPNLDLINQLQQKGVKLTICGQTLALREIEIEKMVAGMRKAYSARTTLSTYQLKGFVVFPIEID